MSDLKRKVTRSDLLAAVLVVGGGLWWASHNTGDGSNTTTGAPPKRQLAQGAPYTPFFINHTRYWGRTVSHVTYALYRVRQTPELVTSAGTFQAQGRYVVVTLAVENDQKSAIDLSGAQFRLIGPGGVRYSTSNNAIYLHDAVGFDQINPGISRIVSTAFDVPGDTPLGALQLRVQGGFSGDTTILPLHPLTGPSP